MSKLIKRPQVALLGALVIVMCALAVTIGLTPDPSVRGKYPSIEGQSGARRPTQIPAPVPAVFQ